MNSTDIFIIIVVGLGALWGVKSGVVRQVLGIAGLIAAFVLAFMLMEPVGGFLSNQLPLEDQAATLAGFGGVFLVVQLVVMILIRLIQKLIGVLKLGLLNRILGALVGGLSAGLLLSIIFLFMMSFGVPSLGAQQASCFYGITSELLPRSWDMAASIFPQLDGLPERFGIDLDQSPEP